MPELPEVENIALGLKQVVIGQYIQDIWIQTPIVLKGPGRSTWRRFCRQLEGQAIVSVSRRAKRLVLGFEHGGGMVIQLGMTGTFLLKEPKAKKLKHTRMLIALDGERGIHFVDVRRFGRIWLFPELSATDLDTVMLKAGMGPIGPEATHLRVSQLRDCLCTQRSIKTVLLDQSRIAGLGNIYVDESLFAAGIHPERSSETLTEDEIESLCSHIKRILRNAIRSGGTTFSDFRNPYGDMGRFRNRLKVYGRKVEPCKSCGTSIKKIVVGGRGTHFCPQCQV